MDAYIYVLIPTFSLWNASKTEHKKVVLNGKGPFSLFYSNVNPPKFLQWPHIAKDEDFRSVSSFHGISVFYICDIFHHSRRTLLSASRGPHHSSKAYTIIRSLPILRYEDWLQYGNREGWEDIANWEIKIVLKWIYFKRETKTAYIFKRWNVDNPPLSIYSVVFTYSHL